MTNLKSSDEEQTINTKVETPNSPEANVKKDIVSWKKLLEAGVHYGHKRALWNPKMKHYIKIVPTDDPSIKRNIHFIDISKTKRALEFAYSLIEKLTEKGANFIFVGTRNRAKEAIKNNALRTNSFYVSERWLGGTLTNWKTISEGIERMVNLEAKSETNFQSHTKKEAVLLAKKLKKAQRNLSGIKNMRTKPNVMIVADPRHDSNAIKEARKSGIKIIGIADSNSDPTLLDIAIPGNDDSIKSVTLIITILADAIAKAKGGKQLFAYQPDEDIILPEEKREFRTSEKNFKRRSSNLRATFVRVKREEKEQKEDKKTEGVSDAKSQLKK